MEFFIAFLAGAAVMAALFLIRDWKIDRNRRGSQDYDLGYTKALNDMHRQIAHLHSTRKIE